SVRLCVSLRSGCRSRDTCLCPFRNRCCVPPPTLPWKRSAGGLFLLKDNSAGEEPQKNRRYRQGQEGKRAECCESWWWMTPHTFAKSLSKCCFAVRLSKWSELLATESKLWKW